MSSFAYTRSTSMEHESSSVLAWLRLLKRWVNSCWVSLGGRYWQWGKKIDLRWLGYFGGRAGAQGGRWVWLQESQGQWNMQVPWMAGSHPAGAAAGQCPAGFTSPPRSFHLHLCIDSRRWQNPSLVWGEDEKSHSHCARNIMWSKQGDWKWKAGRKLWPGVSRGERNKGHLLEWS